MRIVSASLAVRMLVILVFPVVALANNFENELTHQNKKQGIITIKQGKLVQETSVSKDRKKLSENVFDVKTIEKKKEETHNEKRLAHYKPRLDSYSPPQGEIEILVTGYSSTPDQTWGNPFITASGTRVHLGTMACPPQYPFGAKVKIKGRGTYICEDRGGAIKGNHFDMWFESRIEALQWGKRIVVATIEK